MSNGSSALVNKLWNYCNILRDDGLSYGDYVEQLTRRLPAGRHRGARAQRLVRASFLRMKPGAESDIDIVRGTRLDRQRPGGMPGAFQVRIDPVEGAPPAFARMGREQPLTIERADLAAFGTA